MGSGSTGVAGMNLGRKFIGIELEEEYYQIVDKTVFSLVNRKQITEDDIDKRTNLLKKESKYLLTKSIMEKFITKSIIMMND